VDESEAEVREHTANVYEGCGGRTDMLKDEDQWGLEHM